MNNTMQHPRQLLIFLTLLVAAVLPSAVVQLIVYPISEHLLHTSFQPIPAWSRFLLGTRFSLGLLVTVPSFVIASILAWKNQHAKFYYFIFIGFSLSVTHCFVLIGAVLFVIIFPPSYGYLHK